MHVDETKLANMMKAYRYNDCSMRLSAEFGDERFAINDIE